MNDTEFDDALRQALQAGTGPDDAGFSLRVMAALPRQHAGPDAVAHQVARWARVAHWATLSVAASVVAVLLSLPGRGPDSPETVASLALIGLLVFWSLPTRWSRA